MEHDLPAGCKRKISIGEALYERGRSLAFYLPRERLAFPLEDSELTHTFESQIHDSPLSSQQAYYARIGLGDSVAVEVNTAGRQHSGAVRVRLSDEAGQPCSLAAWMCSRARAQLTSSIMHLPRHGASRNSGISVEWDTKGRKHDADVSVTVLSEEGTRAELELADKRRRLGRKVRAVPSAYAQPAEPAAGAEALASGEPPPAAQGPALGSASQPEVLVAASGAAAGAEDGLQTQGAGPGRQSAAEACAGDAYHDAAAGSMGGAAAVKAEQSKAAAGAQAAAVMHAHGDAYMAAEMHGSNGSPASDDDSDSYLSV